MSTGQSLSELRTPHTDPSSEETFGARSDISFQPNGSTRFIAPSRSTRPTTDLAAPERTEGQSAVEVIAARVLTVAVVALTVIALLGFTLVDRQGGDSTVIVVSGVFGISAGVIGLVVGFINAHRAT